jgi:hypothetical protein
MSDQDLYEAIFRAFRSSGQQMGSDLKGLSCLYRNWGKLASEVREEEKKAA